MPSSYTGCIPFISSGTSELGNIFKPGLLDDSMPTGRGQHSKLPKRHMNVNVNGITLMNGASERCLEVGERFTTPAKALTRSKTVHTGSSNQGNDVHPDIHLPKVDVEELATKKTPLVIPFTRIKGCKRGCYYV